MSQPLAPHRRLPPPASFGRRPGEPRWAIACARALVHVLLLVLPAATPARAGAGPAPDSTPAWQGEPGRDRWSWELRFPQPRRVTALHQVLGDHPFVLHRAPLDYEWDVSLDGREWRPVPGTRTTGERRRLRTHSLPRPANILGLRLRVSRTRDDFPVVAELNLLSGDEAAPGPADPWILVVNSTHDPALPGHGQEFIPLARSCPGWEKLGAQQIWIPDLDPAFLDLQPPPLAIFLSGSFKDWCEVDRSHWRGAERVLKRARTPMWASCGGAQALAILADRGTSRPWDCPHCRDPRHPRLPIYGHIGHLPGGPPACGDYSACIFERGPHAIRQVLPDPVFAGLPEMFPAMESHCGQIEYPPRGWDVIATAGPGTRTRNQCLRRRNRPIYAAQFHIEMAGTPDTSRAIMANFLAEARRWRREAGDR